MYPPEFKSVLEKLPPSKIVDILEPFLTAERVARIEGVLSKRVQSFHVAVESPSDVHNAIAITRTAEAMGIHHFHVINAELRSGEGFKTSSGALRWMHIYKHRDLSQFQKNIAEAQFTVVGACVDEGSGDLEDIPVDRPICLLFGNEHRGLSQEAKDQCHFKYKIPMYGMVESYNLSVSAAVSLYHLLNKKRKQMGILGEISSSDYINEKAWYMVRSLGFHRALPLLKNSLHL